MTNIFDGCQSEVGRLKSVVVKHARDAFLSPAAVEKQWRTLNYTDRPAFDAAVAEYDRFVALLEGFGVDIRFLPPDGSPKDHIDGPGHQ